MSTETVIILAAFGTARLVKTAENQVMAPGWAIARTRFFRPLLIVRKFEFKDEADRAWEDLCSGATDDDMQSRDYSNAPPLGEPIPLVDHEQLLKRGRR